VNPELWADVDRYIAANLLPPDPVLEEALRDSAAAGLPSIQVTPVQGKFLHLLARTVQARRILEIGTLGGYSTIWLARALPPEGRLTTLEIEPRHAEVARANLARAGLTDRVDQRLGRALDLLPQLAAEGAGQFDLTFIDADKAAIADYFEWAIRLSRPGGLILVDNVVRKGALADATSTDESVLGVRRLHSLLANDTRVSATTLQTVGAKGYDGLTLALVNPPAGD